MKNLISLVTSLVLLSGLSWAGIFAKFNLSHPFWETRATMIGAVTGIVITLVLFGIFSRWRPVAIMLSTLTGILFIACIFETWYFAKIFIDSAVFEALAGKIWFFGYHGMIAMFVPAVTLFVRKFIPNGKPAA